MLEMGEGGTGPIVVVGASPLIKTIYGTFRSLDENGLNNVNFARSVAEARDLLAQRNHRYSDVPN